MNNYFSIPNKYNRIIVLGLMLSPFAAYVIYGILNIDFIRFYTVFTYLGVILVLFYANKKNPVRVPLYLWFYLIFILYEFYSTFFILNREFKMGYLFSNFALGSFNLMFIVENVKTSQKYYNLLFKISKKILLIALVVILVQQTVNVNFFTPPDKIADVADSSGTEDRLYSIYGWYGNYGPGLSFIPIFILVIEDLDRRGKKKKLLMWILIGIVFAVFSKARWIMVNTILSFGVLVITKRDKVKHMLKYMTLIPAILLIAYVSLNIVGVDAEGIVKDRILESGRKKRSADTRLLAFTAFNKFYWKNALFGKGNIKYGMGGTDRQDYELRKFLAGRSSQIHVGWLSVLYMFGLVGGMFFYLFTFVLLRRMYKNAKLTNRWAPFFAILGFAFANLTLVVWTFFELGLIFAILSDQYFLRQYKNRKALNQSRINA